MKLKNRQPVATGCFFEEERTTQHLFSYKWDETIDAWVKFG
jgi:hypothetical protein